MSAPRVIQRRLLVTGRVQGVGFRAAAAQATATQAELRGWVRNLPDGRVEALACGPEASVLAFAAWCRPGPPTARVESLEVREEPPEAGLTLFAVRR